MRTVLATLLLTCLVLERPAMQSGAKQVINVGPPRDTPFSSAVKAGGFIYVSGTLSSDRQVDIKGQTKNVLDTLAGVLKAAGTSMENVAAVNVYLKTAADFAGMNEVYRTYWPKDPPVRTTVVAANLLRDGLIEIAMVAIPRGGERQVIHSADWVKSPNPYSYGIKSGDTLFMAGLVSRNGRDNSIVEGDITKQTRTVLDNGGEVLKAAGFSFADVAASRVYITDTANFQPMNGVYREYFPKDPPARATVKAGLSAPQYLVEITMTAVKGPHTAITTPAADGTPGKPNPVLSSAIQVGNRVWVSGILGNTEATKGNAEAQTREAMARIGRTLKAAGFDWAHVVDGVVYLTDLANYDAMNKAYRETISKDFPARATVGAGLMGADGLVEIMLTAIK